MTEVVIDASVALAWCFPDEASDYADGVLVALEGQAILVPAVWALEIANAILVGERSKRLRQLEIRHFTMLLESLSLVQDVQPVGDHVSNVLPLALNTACRRTMPLIWNSRSGTPRP
ncbi:MAG: type II toxin-antitoxin system VapC family toxin, partial [Acidobacteriota bacterium]